MSTESKTSECVCGATIEPETDLCDNCAYPSFTLSQMYPVQEYADEYQAEIHSDSYIAYLNNH